MSNYNYVEYFHYEHRDLDVKGLGTQGAYTLDLEHVFVDLRIDATPMHGASANPLRLPGTLLEGSHTIWDYLQAPQVQDQHIVVLGAPGNGKTTLLKHLGLCLLQRKSQQRRALVYTLPILLFLREHSKEIAQNPDLDPQKRVNFIVVPAQCASSANGKAAPRRSRAK